MAKKPAYEFKNLTKIQQDCLTLIESLGIYELRALARVFGDNSPTILKRDDHISIVMNKIISGDELKPIPLRQGRPYKELSNIEGILAELSQLTGKDYTLKTNQQKPANSIIKFVTFRQIEEDIYKKKMMPIEVQGILRERNDKEFYFINQYNGKNVLVKKDLDPRLKLNDYIVGTGVIMNEEKDYILDTIKTINFQNEKTYSEKLDPYGTEIPSKKIDVLKKSIVLGTRYLIKTNNFTEDDDIKKILADFKKNNVLTVGLIPNVMHEDLLTINTLGFSNVFMIKYDERPINAYETITLFIEHIERLQELGMNVAVFVEDMTTIANIVDYSFKNNTKALMGHTEYAVDTIKKLMLLARCGGQNKNTTLFTTFDDADMFDQMYVSTIYKVSKKF